ncbi:hypothetical protein [Granulicella arctica]|uniref:Uncharacterized protein n=1 Tax=Granulicella arctica TaxID=940613 RepID=A0A7Y9PG74_9BACT|nr:hypothetical protein [Granulicella arctica]NYF78576.1 hypothetical protein [Granulicella arctica]
MTLTIDNLNGLGPIDYTAALDATSPLEIARTLNQPTRCIGLLALSTQAVPARRARVILTADNGTILFTGYIATESVQEYLGAGLTGPVYRTTFNAISDEWLLDKQTVLFNGAGYAEAGGTVFTTLTNRVDATLFTTTGVQSGRAVGVFLPEEAQTWSANAAAVAGSTYAAYRAINGALTLQPAASVTHTFTDGDGTLQIAALKTASVKELANDVTVTGAIEPAAVVTEIFIGDGTTTVFDLTEDPFIPTHTANSKYVINDSFNTGIFNPQVWTVTDPAANLGFTSNGLLLNGGNGSDGETTLTAIDAIEMGGTLVIEAGSLQLNTASDGVLCGLYQGGVARANCFAGYNVRQSAGATIITPFINGAEVGTSYTILTGHSYTFRIRLHCAEIQRVLQTYYAMVDGAVESFGGGFINAPMQAVFEYIDLGNSSTTPATILYDTAVAGPIANTPANCIFAAVDSVQLFGSMGYCRITQTGATWITSTLPSGTVYTRLLGASGEGVDGKVSSTGKVTFFAGRIPIADEIVTVTYRMRQRSVARQQNPTSIAEEAAGNAPGTAAWLGKVLKPIARSTPDCESAAAAILSFASARAAAIAGTYIALNPQQTADIWPGDLLALTTNGTTTSVLVRRIAIACGAASPELLTYTIAFANDWAEGLGIHLSEAVATDALLPLTALNGPATVLPTLLQLTVISASTTALQIDAGTAPPTGGGFEVRRRDGDFGPTIDQDLVLRSPVRSFAIPREAQVEQYFVRMYDGSNPPVYSRFSSAVFTDIPVA